MRAGDGAAQPALQLRDLRCRLGRSDIIAGVDLALREGERLALIGPNGSGKSTLFNLISGRLAPDAGEVLLRGQRIDGLPPHRISRLGLARSFQINSLFPALSVFDNLRCGLLWRMGYGYSLRHLLPWQRDAADQTRTLLRRIGLEHRADVPARHLSYAEQRVLEIGIALAGDASVLLLDEPTAGMSRSDTRRFVDFIRSVTEGRSLLLVEHDMDVVFELADRVAVLVEGRVIALDTPQAVRCDPRVRQTYLGALVASTA